MEMIILELMFIIAYKNVAVVFLKNENQTWNKNDSIQ